ncbi:regulatory protein RecX [Brevibacterium oceani]|uniref:regulatory protein RecX n=1 Tax=Brevibacterium oceani TaxID=358099 RepID=UPI002159E204|nr:regulatory protein RecX [Brevibacterium oceani]
MTSKSPDTSQPGDESAAPAQQDGAGESAQAATLSELRSAISEIDQRHAEGEAGFFAGLTSLDEDRGAGLGTGPGSDSAATARRGGRTGTTTQGPKRGSGTGSGGRQKKKSGSNKRPGREPDNGWVEGDTESVPDFVDASDLLADDWADAGAGADASARGFSGDADPVDFDTDEDDAPDFDADYAQAKKTAMNMLAMRDHSREELRKKLLKRDLMPEAVDVLLDKLENSRLLNDEEFAHRFVRAQRENRKLSKSVLKRELSKKGISPELASEAVADVDGEEDLAREVAAKKAASTRRLDYAVRERRILGMLARRGFPSAICIKVTREVLADD